jgi:hypothetical protein
MGGQDREKRKGRYATVSPFIINNFGGLFQAMHHFQQAATQEKQDK